MIGRIVYWEVNAKSTDRRGILPVSLYYDLAPGKYKFRVSRTISLIGDSKRLLIESNTLSVNVN